MCFWIMGLFTTRSLGEGAFITSMAVVLVAPMGLFFFKERVAPSTWVALPLAILGMALLALRQGFQPESSQLFFFNSGAIVFADLHSQWQSRGQNPGLGTQRYSAVHCWPGGTANFRTERRLATTRQPLNASLAAAQRGCRHRRPIFTADLCPGINLPGPCGRHHGAGTDLDSVHCGLLVRRAYGGAATGRLRLNFCIAYR